MSDDVPAEKNENAGQGNYRQRALAEMSKPPEAAKASETKQERRAREAREAVAELKQRAAKDHAFVIERHDYFRRVEDESVAAGRQVWPFDEETLQRILRYVERAIPLDDYSEFPGAAERPGACTLAGLPYRAFRRWQDDAAEGVEVRAALARARLAAADALADRHLHLAQVALETPRMSDAVRVAGEILRWQAQIRNRMVYGEQVAPKALPGNVHIHIGTDAPPRAMRVIDAEIVTETSQQALQAPDATG